MLIEIPHPLGTADRGSAGEATNAPSIPHLAEGVLLAPDEAKVLGANVDSGGLSVDGPGR
jgi:hypothetical protein